MPATASRGRPEDGRHNVHETRNGFEAIQLLWKNPPMLHVFPVEAHPSARGVEEERMDDVYRLPVAREDRFSGGAEHDCAEPGLFANLDDRPMLRILAALDVTRNGGPASSEGADFLAATDDEDVSSVSDDCGDYSLCFHIRQLERTPIRVDDDSVSREQAADVHAVHHRDPREGCADRDDGVRSPVHDCGGTVASLAKAVEHVRADRASFP